VDGDVVVVDAVFGLFKSSSDGDGDGDVVVVVVDDDVVVLVWPLAFLPFFVVERECEWSSESTVEAVLGLFAAGPESSVVEASDTSRGRRAIRCVGVFYFKFIDKFECERVYVLVSK